MEERNGLERALIRAKRYLAALEEQAAGYGSLSIPIHLQLELEDKRAEVAELEKRLEEARQSGVEDIPAEYTPVFSGAIPVIRQLSAELEKAEQEERWDTMIGIGEEILKLDAGRRSTRRKTAEAYRHRGILYFDEGDFELAFADLLRATKLGAKDPLTHCYLGAVLVQNGNYDLGLEYLNRALEADAYANMALYYRGLAFEKKGEAAKARIDFIKASELGFIPARQRLAAINPASPPVVKESQASRAEVTAEPVANRPASAKQSDPVKAPDPGMVTCAEYQAFLEESRKQGKNYQPEHWKGFTFPEGSADLPVTGVRAEDAVAFCQWLTQRSQKRETIRLPFSEEQEKFPFSGLGYWCQEGERFRLGGLEPAFAKVIPAELLQGAKIPAPEEPGATLVIPAGWVELEETGVGGNVFRALTLSFGDDFGVDLAFALDIGMGRKTNLNMQLSKSRARARARDTASKLKLVEVVKAIHSGDYPTAHQLIEKGVEGDPARIALLKAFLEAAEGNAVWEAWQGWRKVAVNIMEGLYSGYEKLLRSNLIQKDEIQVEQQALINLYWWLRIVIERYEGNLQPREGIRVVRL